MRAHLVIGLLALTLAGCQSDHRRDRSPPPRPGGDGPATVAMPSARETKACLADLRRADVRFSPVPDQDFGGGCSAIGSVMVSDVGVPVTNLKAMRCGLARSFTDWARGSVAPAARRYFGRNLMRIESLGSYACRNVIGNAYSAGRRSGHAIANAVDIAAFVLDDGRRITVLQGWQSRDRDEREFLRSIHDAACQRFGTVLSPDYNSAHANHFHLEDDRAGFCR